MVAETRQTTPKKGNLSEPELSTGRLATGLLAVAMTIVA
jgi:hypothetical protein